ncbi:MAG: PTS sugar transporter subunit IIA [Deltaproteobacteria bacterium]|nr:PTS sugar transporter subunit IIA [Deltaproteobacteria bacterium]OQY16602.1 MAG: PTS fructose transporter subunit IIA [Desulfobacterium sp. 4572_20]HDH88443.1 PTS sugar transporter subunit IIA [Desulfobacteraceae bacterium]MBW2333179.1 PTS sugar transporter subunit IIA [Deltaproteobacteria bacterium]MCD6264348.1 PTS sugar transporter subunit IIA [Deltaproteobacteria bacterium]
MKLSEIFKPQLIIPDLKAHDKKGVLEELSQVITEQNPSLNKRSLLQVLLERERLGSTGIGDGIALPHGKLAELSNLLLSFGRSINGLDFDSIDEQPAYLFFLLLAPENSAGMHLTALAKISRMLKDASFRQRLMGAKSRKEIYQVIVDMDEEL